MQVAYLILAHKNVPQLVRLINALKHDSTTIFLHIDARCDFSEKEFRSQLIRNDNLVLLKPRSVNSWGGFSLVETTISLMELCEATGSYNYISLISGMDFPLKPMQEITQFLKQNEDSEFVESFALPDVTKWNGYFGSYRYEKFWMVDQVGYENSKKFVDQQINENVVRTIPGNLTPYGGSQWFTITYNCLRYILWYLKNNPDIISFFRYCLVPDEMIFNTIIMNSIFKDRVVNNNLRHIDWINGPQYPRVFVESDFESLINSQCHFGRKFDSESDEEIILKIENYLVKLNHGL